MEDFKHLAKEGYAFIPLDRIRALELIENDFKALEDRLSVAYQEAAEKQKETFLREADEYHDRVHASYRQENAELKNLANAKTDRIKVLEAENEQARRTAKSQLLVPVILFVALIFALIY
jgi:hypothetical protein